MIDMHCHIVPGIDDGPATAEDAEAMIDVMYKDGIKAAVATSHRNHPINFHPVNIYEEALESLKDMAEKKYPGFKVYSGAEFYVRDGYLEIIDSSPYDFTMNGTEYVLIEFSADADYTEISDAVYEFVIRGYRPVLAHIDKYRSIREEPKLLEELRKDGAYIQITGATLVGKYGKTIKSAMKRLIKGGYVDFIGSDGHTAKKRKPLLKRAYRVVARSCSKAEANRIFIENPSLLLEGRAIHRRPVRRPILGFYYGFRIVPVGAIMLLILGVLTIWLVGLK